MNDMLDIAVRSHRQITRQFTDDDDEKHLKFN